MHGEPCTSLNGPQQNKFYPIVGTNPEHQQLELHNRDGAKLRDLSPETAALSSFGVVDFAYVHVRDRPCVVSPPEITP